MTTNYVIHPDMIVTLGNQAVGHVSTNKDGYAVVDFFEGVSPPAADARFSIQWASEVPVESLGRNA